MSSARHGARVVAPSRKRILVVEDSPSQAAVLTADLESAGFEVSCAKDGETALELLERLDVDLVLTDLVMPGIDGHELCRRVKARDKSLPVVLLTSLDDPIEIVHGLEAGADNFLRKPYRAAQLVSRIETVLYHRDMRAGGRAAMGLEVLLRDQPFLITAERQQILDLLIASFEDLVDTVHTLRDRERELQESEEQLRNQLDATERERRRIEAVFEAAPNPMVITDAHGRITDASDSLCALLGTSRQHLIGRDVREAACFEDASGRPRPAVWNAELDI
jgi:DNA-binding response OmpR family regulator